MTSHSALITTLDGAVNFRDLGGMPLTGGGQTRPGVFYRSEALNTLTPEGEAALAASPIGVIVDFRMDTERAGAPDVLPETRPFKVVNLSVMQGGLAGAAQAAFAAADHTGAGAPDPAAMQQLMSNVLAAIPTLGEMYVQMLDGGAPAFAEVAGLVAASTDETPSAVLIHCTAGKDRTGVSAALILDAVGVERDAIVADYASSAQHLAGPWADGMLEMVRRLGAPATPALVQLITGTPPEAITQALAWVDAHFGGSAQYLQSGGLSDAQLAALRARLAA
ncbi:MAG: tyrosine-protein phosphatase [Microthrixaceae bacterium]|nr:tyrosine-protein phosphatase [Microthrixaceae bacterium]